VLVVFFVFKLNKNKYKVQRNTKFALIGREKLYSEKSANLFGQQLKLKTKKCGVMGVLFSSLNLHLFFV